MTVESLLATLGEVFEERIVAAPLSDKAEQHWLEGRDNPAFDREWCRVNDLTERDPSDVSGSISKAIDSIRERAFKRTFESTGSSEIAGYVSDDFGLIGKGIVAGVRDPWLSGLLAAYLRSTSPAGEIELVDASLDELLGP